jgi:hypothetical protein
MRQVAQSLAAAAALASAAQAAALDRAAAISAIGEQHQMCAADAGRLWGVSLCGPVLIVDPQTREVVADRNTASDALAAADGMFVGKLPDTVAMANTATRWDGVDWTMLTELPADPWSRRVLLMHESFHHAQGEIGLKMASPAPPHLATRDGRTLMRLEWRALAGALRATDGAARRQAVGDALAFRAERRKLSADAAQLEDQLEMNEGLAEYTGQVLSGRPDLDQGALAQLARAESRPTFVRSFAYGTGPAWGVLLDKADPTWRERIVRSPGFGPAAMRAYGLTAPGRLAEAKARWGYAAIFADETARAEVRAKVLAHWRASLVDGPVLRLPMKEMQVSFDPNTLITMPPEGVVYPKLHVSDLWGVLEVTDGALIDSSWSAVTVRAPAKADSGGLSGPGWTLKLAKGWSLGGTADHPVLVAPAT